MVYLARFKDGIKTPAKPSEVIKFTDKVQDFSYSQRGNGGESISFTYPIDNGTLQIGSIYQVFMDKALTQILPCSFILTALTKLRAGDVFYYECEGIGATDLLSRKFLAPKFRNIKFKDLLIKLMDETRLYVPDLSNDYSLITDIDYTFLTFSDYKKYASELIEGIRELGFTIYLNADLKLVAYEKQNNISFSADLARSKINTNLDVLLESSKSGLTYPATPFTSLLVTGGLAETGTNKTVTIIGTGEPQTGRLYDLEGEVRLDDNFYLEEFNSLKLQDVTISELAGLGWDKRYAIYDLPFEKKSFFESQIKLQVRQLTGRSYVLGFNDGNNLTDTGLYAGFLIENNIIRVIANGSYQGSYTSKPYFESNVLSKSDNLKTLGLVSASGLNVGDSINVFGLNTTLNTTLNKITAINGNSIDLEKAVLDGALTNAKLSRIENYTLRIVLEGQNTVKFLIQRDNDPAIILGTHNINIPENFFITLYNNQTGISSAVSENGVYEIDNLALDFWFTDRAKYIRLFDSLGNKAVICKQDQFPTVSASAIINTINKNGKSINQLEFLSPNLVGTMALGMPSTLNKIPIALGDEAYLQNGMRILFRNKAYLITDYLVAKDGSGFIEVSPNFDSLPQVGEPVYINTSIPALNEVYTLEYLQSDKLIVRECAGAGTCFSLYGFREGVIDVPEVTDMKVLVDTSKKLIEEECLPIVSGTLGLFMNDSTCTNKDQREIPYMALPSIGEFIKISDSNQGFDEEITPVQAFQITCDQTYQNRVNITIDFGREKTTSSQAVIKLIKRFGIFRGDSASQDELNIYIPCVLRDNINLTDSLSIVSSTGYNFISGLYTFNFSGSQDFTEPTETLTIVSSTGYPFLSGLYTFNFSGSE